MHPAFDAAVTSALHTPNLTSKMPSLLRTVWSLTLLAFLPLHVASKKPPPNFPNPADQVPPPETWGMSCNPTAQGSPKVYQIQQVQKQLASKESKTSIKNNFDKKCTLVYSQLDAAVYICNDRGAKAANLCGSRDGSENDASNLVTGTVIADAIKSILDSTWCTNKPLSSLFTTRKQYVDGIVYVNGPNTKQNGTSCADSHDAAYIALKKSTNS